jgi:hypothetical protein
MCQHFSCADMDRMRAASARARFALRTFLCGDEFSIIEHVLRSEGGQVKNESIESALARLKASLLPSFDIGSLFARNRIAHKWKATFRSLLLREAVFWRLEDVLQQSWLLHTMSHALGARILVRSALETLATLIYLNQLTESVLNGSLNFHAFSDKTGILLSGSRNKTTDHTAINILTVLQKCAKRYDFIEKFYGDLSEAAHPNYEGLIMGYSKPDREKLIENFSNRWAALYSDTHEHSMRVVIDVFEHEYNDVWTRHFNALEDWLVKNDAELEATKGKPPQ